MKIQIWINLSSIRLDESHCVEAEQLVRSVELLLCRLLTLRDSVSSLSFSCRTSALYQACSILHPRPLSALQLLQRTWLWNVRRLQSGLWAVCERFQSNMEDVNCGTASVSREQDFLFRAASALLHVASHDSTDQWTCCCCVTVTLCSRQENWELFGANSDILDIQSLISEYECVTCLWVSEDLQSAADIKVNVPSRLHEQNRTRIQVTAVAATNTMSSDVKAKGFYFPWLISERSLL